SAEAGELCSERQTLGSTGGKDRYNLAARRSVSVDRPNDADGLGERALILHHTAVAAAVGVQVVPGALLTLLQDGAGRLEVITQASQDVDALRHAADLALEAGQCVARRRRTVGGSLLHLEQLADLLQAQAGGSQLAHQLELPQLRRSEQSMAPIGALGRMKDVCFFVETNRTQRVVGEPSHVARGQQTIAAGG